MSDKCQSVFSGDPFPSGADESGVFDGEREERPRIEPLSPSFEVSDEFDPASCIATILYGPPVYEDSLVFDPADNETPERYGPPFFDPECGPDPSEIIAEPLYGPPDMDEYGGDW